MMRVVSGFDATTTDATDATIATRLVELEAQVAAQQEALDAERERRVTVEAERDRLREAYEALKIQVELAHRRLIIAKAERVDTTQLELDFAATLAALDELAGLDPNTDDPLSDGGSNPTGDGNEKKKRGGGRRVPRMLAGEERIEITDPIREGSVERLGSVEESSRVMWRRGGMVRVVFERVKYMPTGSAAAVDISNEADADSAENAVASEVVIAPDDSENNERATSGTVDDVNAASVSAPSVTRRTLVAPVSAVRDPDARGIVTAPMPPLILPNSYALPSLLAHIATDKFCDGLPLHRQEDRFTRLGATIHRSTMARWLEELGAIVGTTIVDAMRMEAMATAFCIATDATGVRVLPTPREENKRQPCRRAHFFVQIADADHVFFEYSADENGKVVSKLFRGFSGFVQADASSVFNVLFRSPDERDRVDDEPPDLAVRREVGCWSHGRRGAWEAAVATQDSVAREMLARVMRMFQLERLWSDRSPDERKALRDRHLRVHVVSFFTFVEEQFERAKHQRGLLRSALGYCVRQKDALMRFLDDGRLEMTNNRSERQLRRVATGRHAWLFIGSDDHGQAAANLMTLIASARLHKLDPEEYLRDIFRVLPCWPSERYLELAPRYWRQTRARLVRDELECDVGWLTVPEPPPETAKSDAAPSELPLAP
jgi:Transposase IS66 family/IS66 C-terminal element